MNDTNAPQHPAKVAAYLQLFARHRGETAGSYDTVASVYDGFAAVWDHHLAAPALAYYDDIIGRVVRPGATVLDAAAGTGERTHAILQRSAPGSVVAFDASVDMLAVAQTKITDPRVQFLVGDMRHLPFEDNTFDLVSCAWAIEIMEDPYPVVREFLRVIKPDGVVLYACCSLPGGKPGERIKEMFAHVSSAQTPLTHLLGGAERPFHHCSRSSSKQFAGGFMTVATLGKCCQV